MATTRILQYANAALASLASSDAAAPPRTTLSGAVATDTDRAELLSMSSAVSSALAALASNDSAPFRPPKLVVVGAQSSGKSSLLNALIGVHLLPTGASMTTRCAVQVELVTAAMTDGRQRVEFGTFTDGLWTAVKSVPLDDPPTVEQSQAVRAFIEAETVRLLANETHAGGIVTKVPICMRLHSRTVPNMSFVDLPGITMHALTSEGQPADMCDRIRELIRSYIDDRTVVLLVCPARPDLEADAAVELCMSACGGRQTVGCLTKPDQCDAHEQVAACLVGNHSVDLALEHGYFVVRCRSEEKAAMAQTYACERDYFRGMPAYAVASERVGVLKMGAFVEALVARTTRACLPKLRQELVELHTAALAQHSERLGYAVPEADGDKLSFVNDMLSKFSIQLGHVITSRKPDASTGRVVRDAFAALRADVRALDPFSEDVVTDAEILAAVRNCEGWSMAMPVPPVEIVEYFMQHSTHRPIRTLLQPCLQCVALVHERILADARALSAAAFSRFGTLVTWTNDQFAALQAAHLARTRQMLETLLDLEEAYVFTDNPVFVAQWSSIATVAYDRMYPDGLRAILKAYFGVVCESVASQVPKLIVCHVVNMLGELRVHLYDALQGEAVGGGSVDGLLFESDEVHALRTKLTATIRTAEECLSAISKVLDPHGRQRGGKP